MNHRAFGGYNMARSRNSISSQWSGILGSVLYLAVIVCLCLRTLRIFRPRGCIASNGVERYGAVDTVDR